jgi:hypothetical protein
MVARAVSKGWPFCARLATPLPCEDRENPSCSTTFDEAVTSYDPLARVRYARRRKLINLEATQSRSTLSFWQPKFSEIFCHTLQRGGRKDHCILEF